VGSDGVFSMLLTKCAACAAELGLTSGKKCGRCATRYCGPECQVQHWKEGGHDTLCKQIKKSGGAEQYHADMKCAEAVAVAVEACVEDTEGQTCYICLEAVHRRTGEGLVRGCACHTTEGFAHVSCLAEQAKILVAEAEENNLGRKVFGERWKRWFSCSLCEQNYHGVVRGALGWACWKTYLGRPETDWTRLSAMTQLGNGLSKANHHEDALSVQEAELSMRRRLGASEAELLDVQSNLAITYGELGHHEKTLSMKRHIYCGRLKLAGEESDKTLLAALNYANALSNLRRFKEANLLLHNPISVARRVSGDSHDLTIRLRWVYANALCKDDGATLGDFREAVATLEDLERIARRVLGGSHPMTVDIDHDMRNARSKLVDALAEGVRDLSVS
jgi:hypothetical protein